MHTQSQKVILYSKKGFKCLFQKVLIFNYKSDSDLVLSIELLQISVLFEFTKPNLILKYILLHEPIFIYAL